jgi:hypothetical protein
MSKISKVLDIWSELTVLIGSSEDQRNYGINKKIAPILDAQERGLWMLLDAIGQSLVRLNEVGNN